MDSVVVVSAELSCPPTFTQSLRAVLLVVSLHRITPIFALDYEQRDTYWKWLKDHYMLDFSKESIIVGEPIEGLALVCHDSSVWAQWDDGNWSRIIETDRVVPENQSTIVAKLSLNT